MELISYLGKKVHIVLLENGFFYIGKCIDADNNSVTIIDKKGARVSIAKESISSIKETF